MKRFVFLMSLALSGSAIADEEPTLDVKALKQKVHDRLIEPMEARVRKDRKRFKRARPRHLDFRVRVDDASQHDDTFGRPFIRFAIDGREFSTEKELWTETSVGCIYLNTHDIFILKDEVALPHEVALGRKVDAAPQGTCQARAQPKT